MSKLSKKEWLILATAALAIVEVAVGVLISHTIALVLLAIFAPLLVIAFYKAVRAKDQIKSSDVREFQHRIQRRKAYLPQLKEALEALLDKQCELTSKAGYLSLEEYRDKFLKLSLKYRILSNSLVRKLTGRSGKDEKWVILMALRQENFIKNNLYIRELEQREDYPILWREYNKWYSQTPEKPLRNLVTSLIKREKQLGSASSMAQVARREITKSPKVLAYLYKCEAILKNLVEIQRKMVNDEFRELLQDGKPD